MTKAPTTPFKKLGFGLLLLFWLGVLTLFALYFQKSEQQKQNPNQNPTQTQDEQGNAVVKLRANHEGHYQVSGMINGQPVTFLLDTGASRVAVPRSMAKTLGLKIGPAFYSNTANGTAEGYHTEIETLEIGAIRLHNIPAVLLPNLESSPVLLGMSALQQLSFAQEGDQFTLRQKSQ